MTSREDRIQQRLRGAQRRQVKNVDFGLVFPTAFEPQSRISTQQPLQSNSQDINSIPSPSLRATECAPTDPSSIATDDVALKGSAKTSSNVVLSLRENTSRKSLLSIPSFTSNNAPNDFVTALSKNVSTPNANTSRKRRKLEKGQISSNSSQNSRSSRRESIARPSTPLSNVLHKATAGDTRNELNQQTSLIDEINEVEPQTQNLKSSSLRETQAKSRIVEEIAESPSNAPGSGQRIRSDGSFMMSLQTPNALRDSSEQPDISTPLSPRANGQKYLNSLQIPDLSKSLSVQTSCIPNDIYELDELSPEQVKNEKYVAENYKPQIEISLSESDELELTEALDDEQMVKSLNGLQEKHNQGMRRESPDLDTPVAHNSRNKSLETSNKQLYEIPSQFQAQPQHWKVKDGKSNKFLKNKSHNGSHIPITVYRLKNPKMYDDDCADAQILNMEMSHTQRLDVNVMDVLSQICREVVESEITTLQEKVEQTKSSTQRREYRTKKQNLEVFEKTLQTRLLEYSLNLDNAHSLERRLRDEQKKKIHLRGEVLRIRKEREQVALRMDEIRAQYEKVRNEGMAQDSLNDALHHVELAVDLGREKFPTAPNHVTDFSGTELLIKKISQDVSLKSATGGLLMQIKEFNGFLERASMALENKMRLRQA